MKIDRKSFFGGFALIAAVPLLLLWQSSDPAKGTSPGRSRYNVYHFISILNEMLYKKCPAALNLFCDFTLDSRMWRNTAHAETWIDFTAAQCGECADVLVSRGRLCALRGDDEGMRREFQAARAAANEERECRRVEVVITRTVVRRNRATSQEAGRK